jgi:subtilisin family serine protease
MSRDHLTRWTITSLLGGACALLPLACATHEEVATGESTATATEALSVESDGAIDLAETPEADPELALSLATTRAPNRYVVVFKSGAVKRGVAGRTMPDVAKALKKQHGLKLVRLYQHAIDGFAADLTEQQLQALKADERVAYIEADHPVEGFGSQIGATWGLDRIDQRDGNLNYTFNYPNNGGKGVHVYILDSGMQANNPEFGGRVVNEWDFIDNDADPDDCFGHGTHVGGTVGSATYGVAKAATLHSVRVLDCHNASTMSIIMSGVDYITAHHIKPAVVNASLGGPFEQALNDAVARAVAAGITFVAAAGNANSDACNVSPASTPVAITVGATEIGDRRATSPGTTYPFSNYGTCLDLFAPGKDVVSTYPINTTKSWWGTSMATPHVAGAAAIYLSINPTATPAQVTAALLAQTTPDLVTDAGVGSPNRLLYTGFFNVGACVGLCSNPKIININGSYQSGNLGTGAGCFETSSPLHSGNCGNFTGARTMKLNGTQMTCNNQNWSSVPGSRNGGFCIQTSAGNYPWSFFTLW